MDYYNKKYVMHELLKECKNRDFSALGKNNANIRGLWVRCEYDFKRALKVIGWYRNKQNLYRGVATLKNIPKFTFNPKERSKETRGWYKDEYSNQVTKYDLFFDFDKKPKDSWKDLIEDVKILKQYLDEYEVPYYLLFSGNKGFQVIISGEYLNIEKIEKSQIYPHKTIVEDIKEKIGLEFLDLSGNGVNSKLCKIPYSLVGNNIALPLTNEQFENFKVENMHYEVIMSKIKILKRGNLERFKNLNLEQKRRNLQTFINMFNFK